MGYIELKRIFHMAEDTYTSEYLKRFDDAHTIHLDMTIKDAPAFLVMVPELYELVIESLKLDKEIAQLQNLLPEKAITRLTDSLLIDEIVLTNEIEGVSSTRREISEILRKMQDDDKNGRFFGIVRKYKLLQNETETPVATCDDIRTIYDELVLDEVLASDQSNFPDGKLFRSGTVHVVDQAGIPIHRGLEPESKITEALTNSIKVLHDESIPMLVRVSIFHFLFGYIHPFYDGNGRTNRFISSLMLSKEYELIVSFGISSAIKQEIRAYYRGFSASEHPLNKGDLTPFAIAFSQIVVNAMHDLKDSLAEKERQYREITDSLIPALPEPSQPVVEPILAASLFSAYGATASEIAQEADITRQTLYKKLEPLKDKHLVESRKVGRTTYYYFTLVEF